MSTSTAPFAKKSKGMVVAEYSVEPPRALARKQMVVSDCRKSHFRLFKDTEWRSPGRSTIEMLQARRANAAWSFRVAPKSVWDVSPDVRKRFDALLMEWLIATTMSSASSSRFVHPAYQQMIGLGPDAVPLLLQALLEDEYHMSWALSSITGENPVPENARGNMVKVGCAWKGWASRNGYVI